MSTVVETSLCLRFEILRLRSDVLLRACSKNDIWGQHLYYSLKINIPFLLYKKLGDIISNSF